MNPLSGMKRAALETASSLSSQLTEDAKRPKIAFHQINKDYERQKFLAFSAQWIAGKKRVKDTTCERVERAALSEEIRFLEKFLDLPVEKQVKNLQEDNLLHARLTALLKRREIHAGSWGNQALIFHFLLSSSPLMRSYALPILDFYRQKPCLDKRQRTLFAAAVYQGELEFADKLYRSKDQLTELLKTPITSEDEFLFVGKFLQMLFPHGIPKMTLDKLFSFIHNQNHEFGHQDDRYLPAIQVLILHSDLSKTEIGQASLYEVLFARDLLFSSSTETERDIEFLKRLDQIGALFLPNERTQTIQCSNLDQKPSMALLVQDAVGRYPFARLEKIVGYMASALKALNLEDKIIQYREACVELCLLIQDKYTIYHQLVDDMAHEAKEILLDASEEEESVLKGLERNQLPEVISPLAYSSLIDRFFKERNFEGILSISSRASDLSDVQSLERFLLGFYLDKDKRKGAVDVDGGEWLFSHLKFKQGLESIANMEPSNPESNELRNIARELLQGFSDALIGALFARERMIEHSISFMKERLSKMAVGEFIFFPLDFGKNTLYLMFEKSSKKQLSVTIYNTENQETTNKKVKKGQTFCTFDEIPLNKLDFSFFKRFASEKEDKITTLYTFFGGIAKKSHLPSPLVEDWESLQQGQSQTVQCMMAFFRHFVMKKTEGSSLRKQGVYKSFKLHLQKSLFSHSNQQIDPLIQDALKDVEKRLQFEKELFAIAKSESQRKTFLRALPRALRGQAPSRLDAFETFAHFLQIAARLSREDREKNGGDLNHPLFALSEHKRIRGAAK